MKHKSKVHTSKLTSKTWSTFFGFGKREGDNPPTHVKPVTTRQHPIDASTHDRTMNTTGKDINALSTRTDTDHTRKHLTLHFTRKTKQFVAFGLLLLASALTAPVSAQDTRRAVDICDRSEQVRRAILEITSNTEALFDTGALNNCLSLINSPASLAAITALNLSNRGITSLKSGDFDDLTGLTTLRLQGNPITTPLPADIFMPVSYPTMATIDTINIIEIDLAPFGDLADIPLLLTGNTTPLDVSGAFISKDADGNDRTLSFSATSVDPAIATVSLTGGVGTITGVAMGTTNINIVADDGTGGATGMYTRTISVTVEMGVCDRTDEVENAILTATGTPACADVTVAQLAGIGSLDLSGTSITGTLSPRDFAGLSALTTLNLGSTSLTTLPSGVFSALTSLTSLDLSSNSLTTLPAGLFDDLTSLATLRLQGNTFTTALPAGIFNDLADFGTTGRPRLQIDVAPIGDLTGVALSVSGTATINVANAFISKDNMGADRTLSYTLTPANTAIAATATESGGVATITAGASAGTTTVTVTATGGGSTATQTITVTVEAGMDICSRAPQVESAILAAIPGSPACDAVTAAQLAAITGGLSLVNMGITNLQSSDFAGLSGLTSLNLSSNLTLSTLPTDLFSGLTNLQVLDLSSNIALSALTAGLFAGLDSLTTLSLGNNRMLATLPAGLFTGLTSLTTLNLNGGADGVTGMGGLTSLPATIFNPLTNLETLRINGHNLTALDAGLFTGLTSLTALDLSGNRLTSTSLPATIFSGLANLEILRLGGQRVTFNIPASLFSTLTNLQVLDLSRNGISTLNAAVFSGLANLQVLNLDNNSLSELPAGLFTGLSRLSVLSFALGNTFTTPLPADIFDPLPNDAVIDIDIAPIGDVADVMLFTDGETPIDVSGTFISRDGFGVDRTISFSATSGNTAVATVSLSGGGVGTITAGNTAGMATVTITANNGLPDPVGAFSPRTTSTRTIAVTVVPDVTVDICDRTPEIEAAILAAIPGTPDCMDVTEGQLAAITGTLALNDMSISALLPGDFAGLTGITVLNLSGNMLTTLPDNTLSDLTSLTGLNLSGNDLSTLSAGTFTGLGSLTALNLSGNDLTTLPANVFSDLSMLTVLNLRGNAITTLPANAFSGLSSLSTLDLRDSTLSTLPVGVFTGLDALTELNLRATSLMTLPADLFDPLSTLATLSLQDNNLATLPDDIFESLSALATLNLNNNSLSALPSSLSDLTTLTILNLNNNNLGTLAADVFSSLTALTSLNLANTGLSALPDDLFDGLTSLATLRLHANTFTTPLPADIFSDLPAGLVQIDPAPIGDLADVALTVGGVATINVANAFISRNNLGDETTLTYSATPINSAIATASVSGEVVTITASLTPGTTSISITATDLLDVNSATQTFTVTVEDTTVDICDRTDEVEAAILAAIPGTPACTAVTATQLAAIASLDLANMSITALQAGDFAGLSGLTDLDLEGNGISALPAGIFNSVTGLTDLDLGGNMLSALPAGIFSGFTSLTELALVGNTFTTPLPGDIFADLPSTAIIQIDLSPIGDLSGVALAAGGMTMINVASAFISREDDTGTPRTITYTATSVDPAVATVSLSGGGVGTITGVAMGATTVSVTADDSVSSTVTRDIAVTVVATGILAFDEATGDALATPVVAENSGTDMVYVQLASAPASDVTLSVMSSDTNEGTVTPATLTFTAAAGATSWDTRQALTVTAVDDNIDRDDTFTVNFAVTTGDGSAYPTSLTIPSVTVLVTDDDTAGIDGYDMATGGNEVNAITTSEAGDMITTYVELSSEPTGTVTVTISGLDATEHTLTAPASGTLTFDSTNWNTPRQLITITGVDDSIIDGDQTYTLTLTASGGGYDGVVEMGSVTNTDDDVPGLTVDIGDGVTTSEGSTTSDTFSVVLNTQPTADVTVTISGLDATEHSLTPSTTLMFTTTDWSTAQTVTLNSVDDNVVDGDQTYDLTLTPAGGGYDSVTAPTVSVTNTDDDTVALSIADMSVNEDAGTATVTVTLSAMVTAGDVTVNAMTIDGTATAGVDYTAITSQTLTFTAGTISQTLDITINDDTIGEGDETFTVMLDTLVQPTGVTTVSITDATAEVTITDDETVPTTIDLEVIPSTIAETADATEITVTATLGDGSASLPTDTVVTLTISGTATGGGTDYTLTMPISTIAIAALATSATKTFMIDPIDDSTTEGEETVEITGTATINGMTAMANLATLTITEFSDEDQQAIEQTVAAQASGVTQVVTEQIGIRLVSRASTSSGSGGSTQDRQSLSSIDWQDDLAKFTYEGLKRLDSEADMSLDWLLQAAGGNGQLLMPLGAESLTLWATGGRISTKGDGVSDYDGDVNSFILGIDTAFSNDWLAGVAISYNDSEVDYTMDGTPEAKTEQSLYGIHPYLSYTLSNSLTLWGTAGYGFGDIDFSDTRYGQATSDITQWMAAGGVEQQIITNSPWQGALRIKGLWGNAEVDATTYDRIDRTITKVDTDFWRARMESEMGYNFSLPGGTVRPYAIIGGRWDHNDAIVSGDEWHVDVGGGVEVIRPAFALNISLHTQVTDGDTEEHAVIATGSVTYDLEQDGRGLQIALSRSLDNTSPAWDSHSFSPLTDTASGLSAAPLTSELAYGWTVHPFGLKGALQTYVQNSFDSDDRHYAVGLELAVNALTLNFETGYHTNLDNETRGSGLESLFKTKIRW